MYFTSNRKNPLSKTVIRSMRVWYKSTWRFKTMVFENQRMVATSEGNMQIQSNTHEIRFYLINKFILDLRVIDAHIWFQIISYRKYPISTSRVILKWRFDFTHFLERDTILLIIARPYIYFWCRRSTDSLLSSCVCMKRSIHLNTVKIIIHQSLSKPNSTLFYLKSKVVAMAPNLIFCRKSELCIRW